MQIPLAEALDNDTIVFTTGGDADWFGQTEKTSGSASAAKSGTIGNSKSTWMQTAVTGPGTVSFQWRVSSESVKYDYLEFLIDGVQQDKIGGTTGDWDARTYKIGEGVHVLCWNYLKDYRDSSGEDAGYVDRVVWTPDEKVADPVISGPTGADFVSSAEVIISCDTKGATIRYTLDGSDPTEASAAYDQPIVITADVQVRARAFKDGLKPSAIISAAYLRKRTPKEIFGTEGIEWTNDSEIPWREEGRAMRTGGLGQKYASTLTAQVKGKGRLIFSYKACSYSGNNKFTFSLNGSQKFSKYYTESAGTDFSGTETYEIADSNGATFQWKYNVGSTSSDKSYYDYSYCGAWLSDVVWEPAEKVATPVIAGPDASFFDGHADVAVSCATAGATIRYTLDGSDPTESSPAVSGGTIRITDSGTLKVRAYKDGMGASDIAMAQYVKRPVPGVWTTESEIVRQFAATDGRMICVAKLNDSLAAWSTLGPILTGERFLSWAAANGIYLVKWDNRADPSGTSASAAWFKALYAQRGTGSMYNWEMCFARPSSPDTLCGYARAYDSYSVGTVEYDKTVPGVIAGFASILYDNGLMPTPIIAASEIGPFLQTPNFEWHNDSPLSWRDEQSGPTNLLHVGGFVGTAYTATLSATVADQGTLTFDYKVVSANAANTFALKVNGNPAFDARSAGTFSGTETVKVLLNGPATIEWVYAVGSAKDEKSTSGVWISNVKWASAKTPSGRVRPYVRATWKNGKTTYERIEE